MRKHERAIPHDLTRFNYWKFFRPGGVDVSDPRTLVMDVSALHKHHIKQQFELILTASPEVSVEDVDSWFEKPLPSAYTADRRLLALAVYVDGDKEWQQDKEACAVFRQLSQAKQDCIRQRYRDRGGQRRRNWDSLLRAIAKDQARFERFCERPPSWENAEGTLTGTARRIYISYSAEAMKRLGVGRLIPKKKRHLYRDVYSEYGDGSSLLNSAGRLPTKAVFDVPWADLSREEQREAKKKTLHWFHHALRNMREYRNNRGPIPWTLDCAETCRRAQQKLCKS